LEPEIQRLAAELGSPQAIFDYMKNIRYVPGFRLKKPVEVLHSGVGDCDDQAVLLTSLLRAIGEDAYVRIAGISGQRLLHAWVIWRDPAYGFWRNLDPSGTVFFLHDLGYGESIKIIPYVDFNDETLYDYDGGVAKIAQVF